MMHFFRRSKIHLDCYTYMKHVIEFSPVVNAIDVIPEWWKNLPKLKINPTNDFTLVPTMKTCVGMVDYYDKSVAIPLWCELAVKIHPDRTFQWQFADSSSNAEIHNQGQYDGYGIEKEYSHLKIESPWAFQTKDDLNWVMTDPIYNRQELSAYTVAPGLLNFSRQSGTNIQLFLNNSIPKSYIIPLHTPFMLTPMSDKDVVIHRHLISYEAYQSIRGTSANITFINKYRNQQKVTKCPYKDLIK